jgi:ankyrin repeat protein
MNIVKNQKLIIYSMLFLVVNMLCGCSMSFLDTAAHMCTQDPIADPLGYQICMKEQREWAEKKRRQKEYDEYWKREYEAEGKYGMIDYDAQMYEKASELHLAIYSGNTERAIELILTGADINKKSEPHKYTPLHLAVNYFVKKPNIKVVKALLSSGAEINARDFMNRTPLHEAVKGWNNIKIIKALLSSGAEINARDEYDKTPLHLVEIDNVQVIELLKSKGAKY